MTAPTDWPAWMPEPFAMVQSGRITTLTMTRPDLIRWYNEAKAADPALRPVVTRTATGPTPDFEALRPRLDTVFGGDDEQC